MATVAGEGADARAARVPMSCTASLSLAISLGVKRVGDAADAHPPGVGPEAEPRADGHPPTCYKKLAQLTT